MSAAQGTWPTVGHRPQYEQSACFGEMRDGTWVASCACNLQALNLINEAEARAWWAAHLRCDPRPLVPRRRDG